MKKISFGTLFGLAFMSILLIGCNEGVNPSRYDLSEIKNATLADSMMYYSGQMRAAEYWDDALDVDSLSTQANREIFLEGVRDGIKTFYENEVYTKGLKMGERIADNCKRLSIRYGMEFNPRIVFISLRSGLRSDTVVNITEAQKQFYALMNVCEESHSHKILETASKTLKREAKNLGMECITEFMYGKRELEGTGELLKKGDRVRAIINLETMDGDKIPFPTMEKFQVGDRYMNKLFTEALLTMSPGEVKKFAIPALLVIGENCMEYDLRPSETVLVTMKVFTDPD